MNKKVLLVALMFCCATILVAPGIMASENSLEPSQTGFTPTWQIGEEWVLESSHKDLKSDVESWQAPIQWVFKVRAIKEKNGVECYVIHIHANNPDVKNQAVLWLAKDDLRPVRVIDLYPTLNGMKYSEKEVDPNNPQPLLSEDTIVPYDLPVFPLETEQANRAQGADGFSAYGKIKEAIGKKFAKIRNVGGLSFKRTVSQNNKQPKRQNSDGFGAYSAQGMSKDAQQAYSIEISEERAQNDISQTWRQGYPWAVASTKRDRKVRLIKYQNKTNNPNTENGGNEQ
jgi:hypothetical protein